MIQLRQYEPERDQGVVKEWWVAHGAYPLHESQLPATSAMAVDNDGIGLEVPVAVAWMYLDNSVGVGMIAWPVANPEVPGKKVAEGLHACFGFLKTHANSLGYDMVMAASSTASITRILQSNDFRTLDTSATFLINV